jgi:transposase
MAIEITRKNLTAGEWRAASVKARDAKAARRMLAIALVLEGKGRKTAAETCGMDRQTLRDWVHRYNAEGLAAPGRPSRLTAEQKAELAALVEKGPDAEKDGVVRWRCADLKRCIEEMFGVKLHEHTVGKQLKALGHVRLSVRP